MFINKAVLILGVTPEVCNHRSRDGRIRGWCPCSLAGLLRLFKSVPTNNDVWCERTFHFWILILEAPNLPVSLCAFLWSQHWSSKVCNCWDRLWSTTCTCIRTLKIWLSSPISRLIKVRKELWCRWLLDCAIGKQLSKPWWATITEWWNVIVNMVQVISVR